MKTLVTGGAGFIGSNIVRLLVQEGHQVTVLDNLLSGYRCNLDPFPEVEFIEGDVRDAETVAQAMDGVEVVFHLAASVGNTRSIEHPIEDSEINVLGTLRVLEAARHHKVRKVVFSSSAGIFGELKTLPIREDHPVEPDSPYGASKLAAEKLCLAYAKLYPSLECICLRYFNVFGPNQDPSSQYSAVIPKFITAILEDKQPTIYGDGTQSRDFTYVENNIIGNILACSAQQVAGEIMNLACGESINLLELVRIINEILGKDIEPLFGPPRPGDVKHSLADITKAKQLLGYEPVISFHEGIKRTIKWYQKNTP